MSDSNVDHLLLLHLERGQIHRKGEFLLKLFQSTKLLHL